MQRLRDSAGAIAAFLLIALGIGLVFSAFPTVGAMLLCFGVGLAIWQGVALWKARQNRYDLNALWDAPLPERRPLSYDDEPEEDAADDADALAYCHVCGHAVPLDYARCPECGNPL